MGSTFFGGAYFGDYLEDGALQAPTQAAVLGDLTTLFSHYVDTLHDTALVYADSDTLVYLDRPTVYAAHPADLDDANTLYAIHLTPP